MHHSIDMDFLKEKQAYQFLILTQKLRFYFSQVPVPLSAVPVPLFSGIGYQVFHYPIYFTEQQRAIASVTPDKLIPSIRTSELTNSANSMSR